jgi:signal transduction histidine kinase
MGLVHGTKGARVSSSPTGLHRLAPRAEMCSSLRVMPQSSPDGYRHLVTRADLQDVAIAVAVTALGQLDVWAPNLFSTNLVGSPWVTSICYAVAGLVLIWRRRHPLASFCVIAAVLAAQAVLIGTSEGNGVLVPAAIAAYSVAAHAPRRQALLALTLVVPLAVLREWRNPDNTTPAATADAYAWYLVIVAAWLLGAYLRTRRLYVAELAARAARAEQEQETRAATAAAEERTRIAREMHDILAHSVSVMVVQAEAAEEMLDHDPARSRPALQKIQQSGREALVDLRRTLGMLRQPVNPALVPQPGMVAVPALVTEIEAAGLPVSITVDGDRVPLAPGLDLAAYRIIQEALTNSLKHAHATTAHLTIRYTASALHVEVRDNGDGPTAPDNGTGHGLLGLRERAALYGGEVHVGPANDGGYILHAWLPLDGTR